MSHEAYKKLVEHFAKIDKLPIEIADIQQAIIKLGFQDEIIIDGRPAEEGHIRGVFYQYTRHDAVYAPPVLCTIVGYNTNLSVPWQRMACGKELMHIFDDDIERTETLEELEGLVEKLLGPMSTDDIGVADLMAMKDRLALYQSLPLFFPKASRDVALQLLSAGQTTQEKIEKRVNLPPHYCGLILQESWPKILSVLLDC